MEGIQNWGRRSILKDLFDILGVCITRCLVVEFFSMFCMKTAIESLPRINYTGNDKYFKAITFLRYDKSPVIRITEARDMPKVLERALTD
jgi:hypothetical protein